MEKVFTEDEKGKILDAIQAKINSWEDKANRHAEIYKADSENEIAHKSWLACMGWAYEFRRLADKVEAKLN